MKWITYEMLSLMASSAKENAREERRYGYSESAKFYDGYGAACVDLMKFLGEQEREPFYWGA